MSTKKNNEETTEKVVEGVLTLEQFVQRNDVHPGVIASFKVEARASGDDLAPRTKAQWLKAIEAQKNRKY